MQKREKFYLGLFSVLAVLGFAAFAYSQGVGLPSSGSIPNPGHKSEDILCVGCVDTANLKDNSVTGAKIAVAAITDSDIQERAVKSRTLLGGNGWRFTTGATALITNVWILASSTLVNYMGITSWNDAYAEIICDPIVDNAVRVYSGQQRDGYIKSNHQIVQLTSNPVAVYRAELGSTVYQMLEVRSDGTSLSFRRTGAGSASEPLSNTFECHIKILSLCGPSGWPVAQSQTCP